MSELNKELWEKVTKYAEELVEKYQLADENLTKDLLTSAIVQAIKAGDFVKYIAMTGDGMNIIYRPYYQVEQLRTENQWLKEQLKKAGIEVESYVN